MSATLLRKTWRQFMAVESVNRPQTLAILDKFRKFVGCILDVFAHSRRALQYLRHDENAMFPPTKSVMNICKPTNCVAIVKAFHGRSPQTRTIPESHVEGHAVRAIDERRVLGIPNERLSAMPTLLSIPLHAWPLTLRRQSERYQDGAQTAIPAKQQTGAREPLAKNVREENGPNRVAARPDVLPSGGSARVFPAASLILARLFVKLGNGTGIRTVRKTLPRAVPQLIEMACPPEVNYAVRKTHDFRTVGFKYGGRPEHRRFGL